MGYKECLAKLQNEIVTLYYLNHVGYKEILALFMTEHHPHKYYLNHVGYKAEVIKLKLQGLSFKYYLNHVGYKAVKGGSGQNIAVDEVLSEPCGI